MFKGFELTQKCVIFYPEVAQILANFRNATGSLSKDINEQNEADISTNSNASENKPSEFEALVEQYNSTKQKNALNEFNKDSSLDITYNDFSSSYTTYNIRNHDNDINHNLKGDNVSNSPFNDQSHDYNRYSDSNHVQDTKQELSNNKQKRIISGLAKPHLFYFLLHIC